MKQPEELLAALDPQQQEVALHVGGPLCVRAGAGTGKTRAITYRIAYGVASGQLSPTSILAVTFTARAAAEMRSRLRDLGVHGVQARTFHSAALRQLSYFWERAFSGSVPQVVGHKAALVASAATRVGVRVDKTSVRDLAAEIEWAKVSMISLEDYPQQAAKLGRAAPADLSMEDFARIYDAYEQAKAERQVIDFEDVLTLTCGLLQERDDIRQKVRGQYRSFVVDEYQDVSTLQQHLLNLWRGPRRDICVVGDVSQTIYSFAGASPRYLIDFPTQFPEAKVVELNRDYRSTPQVVAVANQVMARARGINGLGPERGLEGAVRLVSQREGGPAVSFRSFPTDEDEARGIAQQIQDLSQQGRPLAQIAVLYRTNAQSEALEQALTDLGLGVQVHGGARFFEREEIRRALVLLRQGARMRELVGEGEAEAELSTQVEDILLGAGWTPEPPQREGASRERWENLEALAALARSKPELSLGQFVEDLLERAQAQAAPQVNGVVLSTLHAAKGLEWDVVFLAGVSEGLIPISLAELPETVEEERRLLYVGITRARDLLQVSYARSRSGGRSQKRKVSRFLAPLWPEEAAPARRRAEGDQSAKQKLSQDKERFLAESDPATLALFEELRRWRLGVAGELSRPAFAVMNDVTLRDIATAKPKTLRQLGAVRGIGHNRLADYGAQILQLIRQHGAEQVEDS